MVGSPDFAHSALAQTLDEPIAPQLLRACGLLAERIDHALTRVGERDDKEIRKDDREEEIPRRWLKRGPVRQNHPANHDWHRRYGGDRGNERLARFRRDDNGIERRPDGDP